jgi:hypothetical protein
MTDNIIELGKDQSALFGYGSLISIASLERTLGRRYAGPFVACEIEGWRRGWDVSMPNQGKFYTQTEAGPMYPEKILYLNIRRAPMHRVNGVLFVVGPEDMAGFDQREWIYDRQDVTREVRGITIHGGPAFAYVGLPEHLLTGVHDPSVAAVRKTYVEILETGLGDWGAEFRSAFEGSCDPYPKELLIEDRQ